MVQPRALTTSCQQLCFGQHDRKHRRHWTPRNEGPTADVSLGETGTANSCHAAVRERADGQQHPQSSMWWARCCTWGMGTTPRKGPDCQAAMPSCASFNANTQLSCRKVNCAEMPEKKFCPRVLLRMTLLPNQILPNQTDVTHCLISVLKHQGCQEEPESPRPLTVIEDTWTFGCKVPGGIALTAA